MRYIWIIVLSVVVGSLGGVGWTLAVISGTRTLLRNPIDKQVSINHWSTSLTIGTDGSDPYTRAWVARYGLLALRQTEAIYFIRNRDDSGASLREDCDYVVEGHALPAEWWSLTVYDTTSFLPMNSDNKMSYDATAAKGADPWSVLLTAQAPQDTALSWISTKAAGGFDVTLRLYVPDPVFLADPKAHLTPPTIRKLHCRGEV